MPLCLVNGAFKPLKGPFHGKRLRGESKVDRSRSAREGRSGSIAQSPARGGSRSSHE